MGLARRVNMQGGGAGGGGGGGGGEGWGGLNIFGRGGCIMLAGDALARTSNKLARGCRFSSKSQQ